MKKDLEHLNVILANAPVKNGNNGCVALTICSLMLISDLLEKKGKSFSFFLPNSYYNDGKKHIVSIENKKIEFEDCLSLPTSIKGFLKCLSRIKDFIHALKIFFKSDYIFDIGQGDSFADIYGKSRFFQIDQIHCIARFFHKPYCLLPQTIGPFNEKLIGEYAAKSIAKANLVIVRDSQSLTFAKELVPKQKHLVECIDVAFFLPFKKFQFDGSKIHIGLNISGLLWNGGYTKANQFGLQLDYKLLVKMIIESFLKRENVIVHLVPHVVVGFHHVENDYEISYNLWKEYDDNRICLAPFFINPCEAKGYISGLDFFIGARMHSTIAAFSSGVPVVPMAYSRKFSGLFKSTLNYNHIIDLKNSELNEAVSIICESFEKRSILKSEILKTDSFVLSQRNALVNAIGSFMRLL